jgi:hypothetical protein
MSHFIELTVFIAGREGSRLDPERHVPTLFNTDHIRWVRAAQDGEKSFLQIGDESGASASYVTVDEPLGEVLRLIRGWEQVG